MWEAQDWKVTILQRFMHGSESFEPHVSFPHLGGLTLGRGAPEVFGVEVQQELCTEAPQDWRKQRLHSWKPYTGFHVHWVPGQSRDYIEIWVTPACGYWRITWENREWLWLIVGEEDIGGKGLGNNCQWELPWKWPFWKKICPPIKAEKPQTKQQTGWEHNTTHQQTVCL